MSDLTAGKSPWDGDLPKHAMLSARQREVLAFLAARDPRRHVCSTQEIGAALGHRLPAWAMGKLVALHRKGLVQKMGSSESRAQCWAVTDAGREWVAHDIATLVPRYRPDV